MLNLSFFHSRRSVSLFACAVCAWALAAAPARADNPRVVLNIADRGAITIELFPKDAPKTTAHILNLVKKKFYDGIKVHRVEIGFVVQMGDPESKNVSPDQFAANGIGSHGSGTTVPLEAKLPHIHYSVGLARAQSEDSGDSQFFINLKDNHQLDSGYCVFGKVVKGMDVVEKIQVGDKITSMRIVSGAGKPAKKK